MPDSTIIFIVGSVEKNIDLEKIKDEVHSELAKRNEIKFKNVNHQGDKIIVTFKGGKSFISSDNKNNKINVYSKKRFMPMWIWDFFLDGKRTKTAHDAITKTISKL